MSEGSKIHQQNAALGFLERDGRVDRNRGTARSSFRIHYREDACPARGSAAFAARCGKAGKCLDQSFRSRIAFQKLASPGTHGGHDGGRVIHFADGKNRNFAGVGLNQFDGGDGWLRVARVNINDNNFGADILHLA